MAKNRGKKSQGKKSDGHTYSNKYKKHDKQQQQSSHVIIQAPPQPAIKSMDVRQNEPIKHGVQTQQQQRAKYALEQVKAILDELKKESQEKEKKEQEFKSHASSLPAMILMNGLGQAAAFYLSKGSKSKAHKDLYTLLSNWLTQTEQPYAGQPDLITGITTHDMHHYRTAQAEALMLLDWVKKFANAYVREN